MHCISIQIQPEFLASFDRDDFLSRVRASGRSPEIDEFQEKGTRYLQFNFFTERPTLLWRELKVMLYDHDQYKNIIGPISIVIIETSSEDATNKSGDEVLVLHHFDKNEKIDVLK